MEVVAASCNCVRGDSHIKLPFFVGVSIEINSGVELETSTERRINDAGESNASRSTQIT